jgi:hypothetical protein
MKTLLIVIFIIDFNILYSQSNCDNYCLNLKDTTCFNHVYKDTVKYPGNIWQIGRSHKPFFPDNLSNLDVIITDTIHPYPVNNHSVFIIKDNITMGDMYGVRIFQGNYNVQTDSLHDYGKIDFSPDNGKTWYDVINDTLKNPNFIWYSSRPILTGNSHGWKSFDLNLADIGSVFNVKREDTILFRFTFISDSIPDTLGGIMFRSLCFFSFVEGVSEIHFKPIKSYIYPNPTNNIFTIEFANPKSEKFQLSIYDIHSKPIMIKDDISGNKVIIDAAQYKPNIYIYKLTCPKTQERSWGKFIITK